MRFRGPLAGVLLAAPFAALALALPRAAELIAKRAAVALSSAAPLLNQPATPTREIEPLVESEECAGPAEAEAERKATPRWVASRGVALVPRHGVRVSADKVLRLANAGMRPRGTYVPSDGVRPAGLRLSGVSALGIGLIDGDVLTHAAGRPALSAGDVVGVVIASRGRGAPEIGGRFWRNGEPWNLVVEQPYLKRRNDKPQVRPPADAQVERKPSYLKRGV